MRHTPRPALRARLSSDRPAGGDERGFVLVWFALLIFVMLGITAFAVDLGHAYLVGQQEQNAADAAALSAASYLPDNCVNANAHALSVASTNGFANDADTTVTAVNGSAGASGCDKEATLSSNEIRVKVKRSVPTWFARAIGIGSLTISRSSTAEYDPPVALGSPNNYFGTMPGCAACTQSNVWASVAGRTNRKVDGNAIYADWCADTSADNCDGNGLNNTDRDTKGMLFQISNPSLESLNIELFDPGYVNNGQTCTATPYPFCTGDSTPAVSDNAAPPTQTTYTLYPLDNLANPLGNPAICNAVYPGYNAEPPATATDLTARSYHKWANFSTDAGGCGALNGSSYVLQVQTGDGLGLTPEKGINNFSLAACGGCAPNQPGSDPNVVVSAITKMSLFTNAPSGTTNPQFYLARVPSWAHGQILTLTFFDVGDIGNGAGSVAGALTVTAADATHGATGPPVGEFSNCTYSHPNTRGNNSGDYIGGQTTPWGVNPSDTEWARNPGSLTALSGCTAQVDVNPATGASFWNGKWVTWRIPIPSDYTCTDTDATKCWLQIQYKYTNAQFHDATTWTASLSGNPVRLTK